MTSTDPKTQARSDRRWWTLAVLCLSLLMTVLDTTIVNIALPTLRPHARRRVNPNPRTALARERLTSEGIQPTTTTTAEDTPK